MGLVLDPSGARELRDTAFILLFNSLANLEDE